MTLAECLDRLRALAAIAATTTPTTVRIANLSQGDAEALRMAVEIIERMQEQRESKEKIAGKPPEAWRSGV